MSNRPGLLALWFALGLSGCGEPNSSTELNPSILPDATKEAPTTIELEGKAVLLGDAVRAKTKLELADPAIDDVVAFETNDGRLLPILPTESGLFFYRDPAVRNRPMRVKARVREGLAALEIIDRVALVDGKPHEIYYWCEICSIRMYHKKDCECCQGPTELREHPVGEPFRVGTK